MADAPLEIQRPKQPNLGICPSCGSPHLTRVPGPIMFDETGYHTITEVRCVHGHTYKDRTQYSGKDSHQRSIFDEASGEKPFESLDSLLDVL